MIKQFENLTDEERELLLKAPALVSVLASSSDKGIDPVNKRDAFWLAHLKTFTAMPVLLPYYHEVEKIFAEEFEDAARTYEPFDEPKREALQAALKNVSKVMAKLDPSYAQALQQSLQRFAHHIRRSTHSVFQDFLFPIPIPGLSA
ncbi:MAG TPA: hypothetical protein VFL47_05185 [Flavisolibacter sp.]|nr:hypothetical protein [Flavisolibacter sp.]